jgi:putative NADH-flavin reductase
LKLVILGATGKTGRQLIKQSVERGHTVTAIVRNPEALKGYDNVNIVEGDVTNAANLLEIINGHDAVLSTLGNNNPKIHLIERSTAAIIEAMHAAKIKRFVVELSFGGDKEAKLTRPTNFLMHLFLGKMLIDQQKGVDLLHNSGIDWTIVYATVLTNGLRTKNTHVVDVNEKVGTSFKISRADVAGFMLDTVEKGTYVKEMPVIRG